MRNRATCRHCAGPIPAGEHFAVLEGQPVCGVCIGRVNNEIVTRNHQARRTAHLAKFAGNAPCSRCRHLAFEHNDPIIGCRHNYYDDFGSLKRCGCRQFVNQKEG
jgi:hypothetical protein